MKEFNRSPVTSSVTWKCGMTVLKIKAWTLAQKLSKLVFSQFRKNLKRETKFKATLKLYLKGSLSAISASTRSFLNQNMPVRDCSMQHLSSRCHQQPTKKQQQFLHMFDGGTDKLLSTGTLLCSDKISRQMPKTRCQDFSVLFCYKNQRREIATVHEMSCRVRFLTSVASGGRPLFSRASQRAARAVCGRNLCEDKVVGIILHLNTFQSKTTHHHPSVPDFIRKRAEAANLWSPACIGVARRGPKGPWPPKIIACLVVLCRETWRCPKPNTAACLNTNYLALPKVWATVVTPLPAREVYVRFETPAEVSTGQ